MRKITPCFFSLYSIEKPNSKFIPKITQIKNWKYVGNCTCDILQIPVIKHKRRENACILKSNTRLDLFGGIS